MNNSTPPKSDELKNLEVEIDGETLFTGQQRKRGESLVYSVLTIGTRLVGVALLLVCVYLVIQGDVVLALNLSILAVTLIVAGAIGLRQFQYAPKRIVLDREKLEFVDTWTGLRRNFPRNACIEATLGENEAQYAIYVTHPDRHTELLVDGLSREVTEQIISVLNQHLRTQPLAAAAAG